MAERALATAYVNIVPGTVDLERYLKTQLGAQTEAAGVPAGESMARGVSSGFGAKIKGYIAPMAAGFAASFAAIGITNFIKESVTAASDFGESANAIKVAFGDAATDVAKLGEDAATRLGLSSTQFNQIATRFSSFAGTIAGSSGDVVGVIDDLSQRGADFASVFNLEVNEALGLFQSGLAGETEPLRRFGIDLSATAVEQYALNSGLIENKKQLTESIKVQARYGLLMQSTAKTAGDFANTSGGLANQQRILDAQTAELQKKLGNYLLPVMASLATFANTTLIPALSGFADVIANVGKWIADNIPTVTTFIGVLGGLLLIFNRAAIATKVWAAAQAVLNVVMAANPMTLIAIAVAALIAGIVYLATKTTFFQDTWKAMTAAVTAAWNATVKFFSDTFTAIGNWFGKYVIAPITAGWNAVISFIRTVLGNITKAVSDTVTNVITFFKNLPANILNGLGNLGNVLFNAGKDLINGLIKGASSLLRNVGKFFVDMLPGWIRDPFKKALGIASPSKVFIEFGKNIMQGLVKGLMGDEESIRSTMGKVVSWVDQKFKDGKLSKSVSDAARNLVRAYSGQLIQLNREHDRVIARLEKAQDDLADRLKEKASFVQSISDRYSSRSAVEADSSLQGVVGKLRAQLKKTQELQAIGDQLLTMGLDKDLYRQIIESGAVEFAAEIVKGGSEAVTQLNVLASETNAQAEALASRVGGVLFDEGIKFAQSVVDGLIGEKARIESLLSSLAAGFAAELNALIGAAGTAGESKAVANANKAAAKVVGKTTAPAAKPASKPATVTKALNLVTDAVKRATAGSVSTPARLKLARGGLVTKPTNALIGEAGAEVVTPLRDFERMMGIDGGAKTINYYAAPNQSIDSEQALFQAIKRAKVVSGW